MRAINHNEHDLARRINYFGNIGRIERTFCDGVTESPQPSPLEGHIENDGLSGGAPIDSLCSMGRMGRYG